jgi:hypothetical protein
MSGGEIGPELVERMVALVRSMLQQEAEHADAPTRFCYANHTEARAIAALLPEPVDPDLIEAREAVCRSHHDKHPESPWHQGQAELVRSGSNDRMLDVLAAYEAIKRGRELERAGK